jgi:hypothetical protein
MVSPRANGVASIKIMLNLGPPSRAFEHTAFWRASRNVRKESRLFSNSGIDV